MGLTVGVLVAVVAALVLALRRPVVRAVCKRNFLSYFSGMIGYLFILVFVVLSAFLAFNPQFFGANLANLDQLNKVFPIMLLFIVPAITMGAWADEKKLGTDELLFTLPARDVEVVAGKYLAVLAVYTVALFFAMSLAFVLGYLGRPDYGLLFSTYFGYWISGAALLSAGMVASVLTNSATVAYVLGSLICAIPVFIDHLSFGNRLIQGLSVSEQFREFGLGLIPLGSVLYFLSFTLWMMYVNLVLVSRRHWAGGPHNAPMGLHYLVRMLALALILISANVVAANVVNRIDLTSERIYSLAETTTRMLSEIKPDRQVRIQAFISPEVPREYAGVRSTLIGLLRQFEQIGGRNISVRIVDTERFSASETEASRFGIEPQEIVSERGGRLTRDDVFMGAVVSAGGDDEVVIPFVDLGTPVEYELTRAIRTVVRSQRKKVGVLRTDAKVMGGMDFSSGSFQSSPEWRIITELKRQYEVKEVGPAELKSVEGVDPGKRDFDVLLAIMPSSLGDEEMAKLVDYIKSGGPTLVIDDPFPITHPSLAPRMPKPRAGGMMGGAQPTPKSDGGKATKLTDALEIAWNSGDAVWDTYDPHPELTAQLGHIPNIVYVGAKSGGSAPFSQRSEITKGLQEVMLIYPGELRRREGSKLEFEPLLRTAAKSAVLPWEDYVRSSPFGMTQPLPASELKLKYQDIERVLAARISGQPEGSSKDGKKPAAINAAFIADMDMISDAFFFIRDKQWQGLKLDNITVVMNALDDLAGDDAFIGLRKRRALHRTLSLVEDRTAKFKQELADQDRQAEKEAKDELDKQKAALDADVEKIQNDDKLDRRTKMIQLMSAQTRRQQLMEQAEKDINEKKNRSKKQARTKFETEIRHIENRIRTWALLLLPLPVLLVGSYVFFSRMTEERQGANPERVRHNR
jgi:ABC-2 type transport system permease protein